MATQKQSPSIWQMDKDHFIHPYTDYSTFGSEGSQVINRASGVTVSDDKGREYLDAIAGLWCVNIGHGREEMADAIRDQVLKMQYYNPFGHSTNEPAARLAAKLAELAPGSLNHVFFSTGGSTANDVAARLAHYYFAQRGLSEKKKIISRIDGYHGSTYFAANLTGIHGTKIGFNRLAEDMIHHVSSANLYRAPEGMDEALRKLGYDDFRLGQREAIETLFEKNRLLLVAPTGGGKSLTYQLPACLLPGTNLL